MKNILLQKNYFNIITINSTNPSFSISEIDFKTENESYKSGSSLKIFKTVNNREEYLILELFEPINKLNQEIANFLKFEFLDKIVLRFESLDLNEIELVYSTVNNFISFEDPQIAFKKHLELPGNERIVFSGPFGSGKSTFINDYFKNSDDYNVFEVYPVNYSVASNEDIFKYIKADILFQLIVNEEIKPENNESLLMNFTEKVIFHPEDFIKGLIRLFANLGKDVFPALKNLDVLEKYIKELKPVSTFDESNKYLQDLISAEGSLFEDNATTQIIRGILNGSNNKKNILIIEDLDRMDPDHIFRILNIISAHIDSYTFGNKSNSTNKFGFDKILVVCDLNNIESIYRHRFGYSAQFEGYINKFYSLKPFSFTIKDALRLCIDKIDLLNKNRLKNKRAEFLHIITVANKILNDLISTNQIRIRELNKFSTINPYDEINSIYNRDKVNTSDKKGFFILLLSYLNQIPDLKSKLRYCKENPQFTDLNFDIFVPLGFVPFSERNSAEYTEGLFSFDYKKDKICFNHNNDFFYISPVLIENSKKYYFNNYDFYEILELNLDRLHKIL